MFCVFVFFFPLRLKKVSIEWNKKYKLGENFIDKVARHVTEASDTLLIIHKNSIVIVIWN